MQAAADPYRAMTRGALAPTLVVAAIAVGASALTGPAAVAGAALGAGVVVVFFGLTLLLMRAARRLAPQMLLGVALALYGTKVAVIGGLVLALRDQPWLSPPAFAVAVVACAVAWLAGQVAGFRRARVYVTDPEAVGR